MMFCHLKNTILLRGSQFLETAKASAGRMPLICAQPNLLLLAGTQAAILLHLTHHGVRYQQLETSLQSKALGIIQTSQLETAHFACLAFPREVPGKLWLKLSSHSYFRSLDQNLALAL